ncbi:MAG: hypothetical protein K5984_04810, partial [Bacteroidales bacterium]|nr:hypothetical protein [Bacteroidales bacterium]
MLQSFIVSPTISNHNIRGFAEDTDGHIWMGTFRGLNKYDNHNFKQYYWDADSLSLPDNQINAVHVDQNGRLWAASVFGLAYYTDQDNFRRVKIERPLSWNINQMVETSKGLMLFL